MGDFIAVRRAVDRLLEGVLGPLLRLLSDDVEFEVTGAGDLPGPGATRGRESVADYFAALSGLVAFWQMDYTARGRQVIAWGAEQFTLEGCGLEGESEFALVFELAGGMVTRLEVIEDVRAETSSWDGPDFDSDDAESSRRSQASSRAVARLA